MSTTPQALLSGGGCFACYGLNAVQIMTLSLLAQWLLRVDPDADIEPAHLLRDGRCYACFSLEATPYDLMELALLAAIVNAS